MQKCFDKACTSLQQPGCVREFCCKAIYGRGTNILEDTGWYNGYSWKERLAKLRVLNRRLARGEIAVAAPPCQLCGDPEPKSVEYHDEDYSKEYLWESPALYILCRNCHRTQLHKRFARPNAWKAFVAHVLRGGYARDLAVSAVKREVHAYELALGSLVMPEPLPDIPGRAKPTSGAWFESLSIDPVQASPHGKRPRP